MKLSFECKQLHYSYACHRYITIFVDETALILFAWQTQILSVYEKMKNTNVALHHIPSSLTSTTCPGEYSAAAMLLGVISMQNGLRCVVAEVKTLSKTIFRDIIFSNSKC